MNCSSMKIEDLQEGKSDFIGFYHLFYKKKTKLILEENIPFIDYLKKQKLNDTLCHLIINSISMVDYNATTKEVREDFLFFLKRN